MTESNADSWLGRRVRSYEVLSHIGAGGWARSTGLTREGVIVGTLG